LDAPGEGWSVGARADLWRLRIDWRDDGPPSRTGLSRVTVFVPAVEGGHSWKLEDGARFDLTLGLGYEFNLDTDGRDVGEGAILTLGASFTGGTRSIRRLHEGRHPVEEPNRDRDVLSQVRVR
jgi:hypothetical protein